MNLTFKDLAVIYNALNAQKSNLSTSLTTKKNVETIRNIEDILLKFEGTKKTSQDGNPTSQKHIKNNLKSE